MSPLFMDTGYEPNSPGSISADDSNSHTAGSEREGEGQQLTKTGTKRREKNRDAARKSRRKQTERADELHEELQRLERSNSTLQKEIAGLKKDLQRYTTAMERHEPYCCLRASASSSSSSTGLSVSPSANCQTVSSPPRVPPKVSNSTLSPACSLSTSLNSSLGLQTLDCVENAHFSPSTSAPTTTTLTSSFGSSSDLFITSSSSPETVPYSLCFSTLPAPHSLFSEAPLMTSRPTNVTPVSRVSNPVPSSTLTVAAQPQSVQEGIDEMSSLSADACLSTLHSDTLDAFLMKQPSLITDLSKVVPPYSSSHVPTDSVGIVHSCRTNTGLYSTQSDNSSPPCSLLPSTLQDPARQPLSVSPQSSLELFPASAFASKPSYSRQITPNSASLLSLLTVPSPLNVSQTTSNSLDGLIAHTPLSLPLLGEPSKDLSLSELLEVNDWILSGTNNQ